MKRALGLFLLMVFAGAAHAGGRIQIEILEKYGASTLAFSAPGARWLGKLESGEVWERKFSGETVEIRADAGKLRIVADGETLPASTLQVRGDAGGVRISGAGFAPRLYRGFLKIGVRGGKLWLRDELDLEDYVAGVLPGEIFADSPIEAIKAQAILIRSYALKHRAAADRHPGEGFDFCDLTHCQVFTGSGETQASYREAAAATRGQVLQYRGALAETLFHSTCGGHTSANQAVFQGRPEVYLQGVDDTPFCQGSPHADWKATVPLTAIDRALSQDASLAWVGPLGDVQAASREPKGRWFTVELVGPKRMQLSAEKFLSLVGREIGWNQLQSAWFDVEIKDGVARFSGHGLGHGVGLCQEGAIGMARAGKDYREILAHYFPGTRIARTKP